MRYSLAKLELFDDLASRQRALDEIERLDSMLVAFAAVMVGGKDYEKRRANLLKRAQGTDILAAKTDPKAIKRNAEAAISLLLAKAK